MGSSPFIRYSKTEMISSCILPDDKKCDSCEVEQIDWNEVWKHQFERSGKQQNKENVLDYDVKEHALHYLAHAPEERTEQILRSFPGDSDTFRVLDIGAGPGRIAVPLSGKVAHVTAVEPGKGMREVLKDRIAEYDIRNITIVGKRWEEVDIVQDLSGQYDLVIAAHSLEMPDICDAVRKMCRASRRWVYLFWNAGISGKERRAIDLWPVLYGCDYHAGPKSDVLYHILHDMGIYPNTNVDCFDIVDTYPDLETAVAAIRKSFPAATREQERILRNYLEKTLIISGNGCFFREREYRVTLWWDVSGMDNFGEKGMNFIGEKNNA